MTVHQPPETKPDDAVIVVSGLRKSYGDVVAIDGLDLEIRRGEIFAMLGPNGAGKTTTIEILEGFRARDAGAVSVLGCDPGTQRRHIKGRMGIVLQSTGVDPYLSVAETVAMYAMCYPNPRPVDEVIDLVGLAQKRDTRVLKLSGGQRRRLDVAIALAGDPELLFLDEPTTGFDPSARHEAWEVVRNLSTLGKTVLLTTHYMDEAQSLAHRVAVVAAGRIVAQGSPSSLGGRDVASARLRYRVPTGLEPPAALLGPVDEEGFVELRPDDLTTTLHELTGWALGHGVSLDSLQIVRPSLEDVYLRLINESSGAPR
jgi:ABC-2 type transport system ATP-binding protein